MFLRLLCKQVLASVVNGTSCGCVSIYSFDVAKAFSVFDVQRDEIFRGISHLVKYKVEKFPVNYNLRFDRRSSMIDNVYAVIAVHAFAHARPGKACKSFKLRVTQVSDMSAGSLESRALEPRNLNSERRVVQYIRHVDILQFPS